MKLSAKQLVGIFTLTGLFIMGVFYKYTPLELWPKCWWLMLTGTQCPGCGSQRAIASMLDGDFMTALKFNPILFLAIPYICLLIWVDSGKSNPTKQHINKILFSSKGLRVLAITIIIYWIGRNLYSYA